MKTIEEIWDGMLDVYGQKTGLRPSTHSEMALRLYGVASQIYALQVESEWVKRQSFPQTATEEYLDYHGEMRGLTRKEAGKAQGSLCFSTSAQAVQDLVIPCGTIAMTAGLVRVETMEEGVLPRGETTVTVKAQAVQEGTVGNLEAGMIVYMAVPPVGIGACTNLEAFEYGVDREEDESFRSRILDTFKRLPNGANAAFYLQEALAVERVVAAKVEPRSRGVCTVDVIIASMSGEPEEDLIQEVQQELEWKREIAVDVLVRAPTLVTMDLEVLVRAEEDVEIEEAIRQATQAVESWFDGTKLGVSLLEGELGDLIYRCEGVLNYQILTDLGKYEMNTDELPRLGQLIVREMS